MADPQVNFFKSTLVGTYSDSDTSFTIATGDGALLPDPSVDGAFNLTIFEGLQVTGSTSFEIVRVTARSGDVLTVTRGQESTTPLTIGSAVHSILMSATKKTFDDINTAIENVDLTSLTGAESITFDTTGDEEFGLPAGTTAQRPASPSAGYMRFNTDTKKLEVHTGGVWGLVSLDNVLEMQVAQATAIANDAVFAPPLEVEYLVIAGGGGGGSYLNTSGGGGGGGAGGYRSSVVGESSGGGASAESTLSLTPSTNYTITIGGGGAGGSSGSKGVSGSNSVFSTITSTGGGGAGSIESYSPAPSNADGESGGSGGGASRTGGTIGSVGSGTANEGYDGGLGASDGSSFDNMGGGGGAGQVGANATSGGGGNGGNGVESEITGSAVTRAGGGGGAGFTGKSEGSGGTGGGGNANGGGTGTAGSTNLGGGGGGGTTGASGGSGVVILRYPSEYSITIGAGLTGSESTDGSDKYAVITAGTGNVSWST